MDKWIIRIMDKAGVWPIRSRSRVLVAGAPHWKLYGKALLRGTPSLQFKMFYADDGKKCFCGKKVWLAPVGTTFT